MEGPDFCCSYHNSSSSSIFLFCGRSDQPRLASCYHKIALFIGSLISTVLVLKTRLNCSDGKIVCGCASFLMKTNQTFGELGTSEFDECDILLTGCTFASIATHTFKKLSCFSSLCLDSWF